MQDYIRRRRLKSVKLGVAAGIVYGFYMALTNQMHLLFPAYAKTSIQIWQELYPGFRPNFWGSFVLFGWGFIEAFYALWVVGTLYNWLTQSGYGCRTFEKSAAQTRPEQGHSGDST